MNKNEFSFFKMILKSSCLICCPNKVANKFRWFSRDSSRFYFFSKLLKSSCLICCLTIFLFSCSTTRQGGNSFTVVPSASLLADGIKSEKQLYAFFMDKNPNGNHEKVRRLAKYYVKEAAIEGINSDAAFVQMCLETGFLRFGGLVTEDMNNFCGLGAIDEKQRGNVFPSEEIGVRAHIQHLKAYATPESVKQELVDIRYKWVNPKGKAPTVLELSGTWAADKQYGEKLFGLLQQLAAY